MVEGKTTTGKMCGWVLVWIGGGHISYWHERQGRWGAFEGATVYPSKKAAGEADVVKAAVSYEGRTAIHIHEVRVRDVSW